MAWIRRIVIIQVLLLASIWPLGRIALARAVSSVEIPRSGDARTFKREAILPGGIRAMAQIVSRSAYESQVQHVFDYSFGKIREIADRLDASSPSSDVSKVNAQAGGGAVPVSKSLIRIVNHGKKLSDSIGGSAFAITDGGSASDIKVDKSGGTISISSNTRLNLDGILRGYLADMLLSAIYNSNIDDAMVRVDGVQRSVGYNIDSPWQYSTYDSGGGYAHHGITLIFSNLAIATVGSGEWSPPVSSDVQGVSVLGKDAATTNAIATAAYALGSKRGMDLIRSKGYRCVMIERDGRLIKSPGL